MVYYFALMMFRYIKEYTSVVSLIRTLTLLIIINMSVVLVLRRTCMVACDVKF